MIGGDLAKPLNVGRLIGKDSFRSLDLGASQAVKAQNRLGEPVSLFQAWPFASAFVFKLLSQESGFCAAASGAVLIISGIRFISSDVFL